MRLNDFEQSFFGTPERTWFEIDSATQGTESISMVEEALQRNQPYSLAFIDVRMPPGLDGIETTRRLWKIDPHLQVVLCTAYSDYSWDQMQEELGGSDRLLILKKPFDAVEVQQMANALVEKWRLSAESRLMLSDLDRLVTERTAQLEASQKKVRDQASLLDKASDAIFVKDMEHRVTYWNKSAETLYGWTAQEAAGRPVQELVAAGGDCAEADTAVRNAGEWVGELRQTTKDGRDLVLESRWTLVAESDGQAKSVMVINTDVTEKWKMEAHFLRAQRMESIGTLAAGIAHDLNNTLLPIILSIDLLKLRLKEPFVLGVLATIESSAKRSASMVQQVLSFSRGVEGERLPIDPRAIIDEVKKLIVETFPKNISLVTSIATGTPTLEGDCTQVHQLLLNLCVNARDAMPEGGTLTLKAEQVEIGSTTSQQGHKVEAGSYVMFEVEDTGGGIDEVVKDKIFDPFFTTKEVGKGTGLGLTSAMAIVTTHRGFITLDSGVGRGSKFRVFFPACKSLPSAPSAAPSLSLLPALKAGQGQLVLLVDDEDNVRDIACQTLEAFGYKVVTARNGYEAVSLYTRLHNTIDVVLTDMMMPVMDGAAAIRAIRKINPEAAIIAATGLQPNLEQARMEGAAQLLPKPYTAATMLETLETVLQTHP
ncbi:MAG: hypothetical protein B7Z47_05415, partial [Chthoniobacter sp. 12-60-6]